MRGETIAHIHGKANKDLLSMEPPTVFIGLQNEKKLPELPQFCHLGLWQSVQFSCKIKTYNQLKT